MKTFVYRELVYVFTRLSWMFLGGIIIASSFPLILPRFRKEYYCEEGMCFRCGQLEVQKTDSCHVEQMQQIPSLQAVSLQRLSIRSSLHHDAKPCSFTSALMIRTKRRVNSDGIQEKRGSTETSSEVQSHDKMWGISKATACQKKKGCCKKNTFTAWYLGLVTAIQTRSKSGTI